MKRMNSQKILYLILQACVTAVVIFYLFKVIHTHTYFESRQEISDRKRQERLTKMLIAITTVFNDHDVYYWVDFGTLLGLHREGGVILGDNDIDICIVDDSATHQLMKGPVTTRLTELGYRVTKETWSAYRVWKNGIFADIYLTAYDGDTIKGATGPNSNIAKNLVGIPQTMYWKLGGVYVKVPEYVEEVLVWRYGDDFMTPRPGFKGRDS